MSDLLSRYRAVSVSVCTTPTDFMVELLDEVPPFSNFDGSDMVPSVIGATFIESSLFDRLRSVSTSDRSVEQLNFSAAGLESLLGLNGNLVSAGLSDPSDSALLANSIVGGLLDEVLDF